MDNLNDDLINGNNENSDYISNNREPLYNLQIRYETAIRKSMTERNFLFDQLNRYLKDT